MAKEDDENLGFFGKIKKSLNEASESKIQNDIERSELSAEEIEQLVNKARGDSVTFKRVARIARHLDPDEQPHYLNKGGAYFGLRIEGGDTEIRKGNKGKGPLGTFNNMKGNLLVATNKRVFIISMQTTGDDVHSIPYDSISGVDSAMGVPMKITIQTHGRTYHMEIGNEEDDISEVINYIRERRNKVEASDFSPSSDDSPLEKIEKLAELRDNGVISENEFDSKKADLMDEI